MIFKFSLKITSTNAHFCLSVRGLRSPVAGSRVRVRTLTSSPVNHVAATTVALWTRIAINEVEAVDDGIGCECWRRTQIVVKKRVLMFPGLYETSLPRSPACNYQECAESSVRSIVIGLDSPVVVVPVAVRIHHHQVYAGRPPDSRCLDGRGAAGSRWVFAGAANQAADPLERVTTFLLGRSVFDLRR